MRLTGTKTTVQVGRLAGVGFETTFDEVQRIPEALHQLISDNIVLDCLLSFSDTLSQFEDELSFVDGLGNLD